MAQYMGWGAVEEAGWRKGPWTAEEDRLLVAYVNAHGEGRWNNVARLAGLKRNGKSCRLRWVNYLRPDLKRGRIMPHEENMILQLHAVWGNRWSTIARSIPGRTDNEIKNYWRTHFKQRVKPTSQNTGRMRARLLRRQQFFQRQQLQQRKQDQLDMQMVIPQLFDNEYTPTLTQGAEDAPDEQGLFYSIDDTAATLDQASSNEDMILWNGLWDLDDLYGNVSNKTI